MITFNRVWAMPSADTFDVPPIGEFVKKYLRQSKVSIDPFARNKRWATYTNDLNPDTAAEWHMDALDFLKMLQAQGVKADLVIWDAPYSIQQIKEVYASVGLPVNDSFQFNSTVNHWTVEKELCYELLVVGGVFLHFGYHSNGMGKGHDMVIEEILLISHGAAHNDTICIAERKVAHQYALPLAGAA